MSNVLIGIIGVILFIGLALAGALFLGPRFQSASIDGKAAAIMTAVSQGADAANMHNLQEGRPVASNSYLTDLVAKGYLKSIPVNPVQSTWNFDMRTKDGINDGVSPAAFVETGMPIGEISEKVCESLNRQYGIAPVNGKVPVLNTSPPANPQGCFRTSSWGDIPFDMYIVYKRI